MANESLWDLTLKGGWIMIPLALLAIVSIYIFFERTFAITGASREDKDFMQKIKTFIHQGKIEEARALCQQTNSPSSRMIEKGISRIGRPMNDVLVAVENVGNIEVSKLERASLGSLPPQLALLCLASWVPLPVWCRRLWLSLAQAQVPT